MNASPQSVVHSGIEIRSCRLDDKHMAAFQGVAASTPATFRQTFALPTADIYARGLELDLGFEWEVAGYAPSHIVLIICLHFFVTA